MQARELTEIDKNEMFEELHHGISLASHYSGVYESIYIIEAALKRLWESGVTDIEILSHTYKINLDRCYNAIQNLRDQSQQRVKYGLDFKDELKLRYLLTQVEYPSYTGYLAHKKQQENLEKAKIQAIRASEEMRKLEYHLESKKTHLIQPDHPIITRKNIYKVFGTNIGFISYKNDESKDDVVFKIYSSELSSEKNDFIELSRRLNQKKINHQVNSEATLENQYIEFKGDHASQLKKTYGSTLSRIGKTEFSDDGDKESVCKLYLGQFIQDENDFLELSKYLQEKGIDHTLKNDINKPVRVKSYVEIQSQPIHNLISFMKVFLLNPLEEKNKDQCFAKQIREMDNQLAGEFNNPKLMLPKHHQLVLGMKNIQETCSLSKETIFKIKYEELFGELQYLHLIFDTQDWECARLASNFLLKKSIIHELTNLSNHQSKIALSSLKGLPDFIDLLKNNINYEALQSSEPEAKINIKEESDKPLSPLSSNKISQFYLNDFSFSPTLFRKSSIAISKELIVAKFGENIANKIKEVDTSDFSLIGLVLIKFTDSISNEYVKFCKKLDDNHIPFLINKSDFSLIILKKESCRLLEKYLSYRETNFVVAKNVI